MADLYRVTWIFRGPDHGWSESLIYSADGQTPAGVSGIAINTALARAALLGRGYSMKAQRCAKIRFANGQKIKNVVKLNEFNFFPSQEDTNAGDEVNQCVQVQFSNAAGDRKKKMFMGGIPDGINQQDGTLVDADNGWSGRFNTWKATLAPTTGASWGWLGDDPATASTVIGYTSDAQGYVTFSLDTNIFAAPLTNLTGQQTVRVKQLNSGHSALNKALVVIPLPSTAGPPIVYHCKTVKAIAVLPFTGNGVMTAYNHGYQGSSVIEAQAITEHKRGRPIGASRGRLPVQVRV
jgi:hypothetical protein